MKEKIIALVANAKRVCRGFSREKLRTIGWYAGLFVMLAALGLASAGWRRRLAVRYDRNAVENTVESELQQAASMYTPEPLDALTSLPQPTATPEPLRFEWPVSGEVVGEYAPDELQWSQTLGQWQAHPALDLAAEAGEAVCACAAGVVTDAWEDALWGKVIRIEHAEGYVSTYANLDTLKLVKAGDEVSIGQAISTVGDSAICESEMPRHLHFELYRDGQPADFEALMKTQDNS